MYNSQLCYFILKKKEYLVFLEESMNHSHLVWTDITVLIIKTEFCSLGSYVFPDTDGNGESVEEADTSPSAFLQALVPAEMQ